MWYVGFVYSGGILALNNFSKLLLVELCQNLESKRPRNRWKDEVREDRRIVGG
jgi:hypothetical protein